MKENLLEVGDEIFYYQGYSGTIKRLAGRVDRITKTLAYIGNLKLRRDMKRGYTQRPGDEGYAVRAYYLVTDETRKEIMAFEEWIKLSNPLRILIDNGRGSINHLTNSQLERINAILAEDNNG